MVAMPPRVNLYVGADLYERARAGLGDEANWSEILRRALERELAERASATCNHPVVICRECNHLVEIPETGAHT